MLKKYLTCKTHLKAFDDFKVVARLDPDEYDGPREHAIVTEPGDTKTASGLAIPAHLMPDHHYLVGPIADRLYEYEHLGYSPEELREIIARHKFDKAREDYNDLIRKHLYYMPARANGKSLRATQILLEECLKSDIDPISSLYPSMMIVPQSHHMPKRSGRYPWGTSIPRIENVIFNDPATIVFWEDGSKTVVKTQNGDVYDPEKGLAMAISKKALGNKRNYYNVFKKWLKKYVPNSRIVFDFSSSARAASGLKKLADALRGE